MGSHRRTSRGRNVRRALTTAFCSLLVFAVGFGQAALPANAGGPGLTMGQVSTGNSSSSGGPQTTRQITQHVLAAAAATVVPRPRRHQPRGLPQRRIDHPADRGQVHLPRRRLHERQPRQGLERARPRAAPRDDLVGHAGRHHDRLRLQHHRRRRGRRPPGLRPADRARGERGEVRRLLHRVFLRTRSQDPRDRRHRHVDLPHAARAPGQGHDLRDRLGGAPGARLAPVSRLVAALQPHRRQTSRPAASARRMSRSP